MDDFFGKLKSLTKGYASLDFEDAGYVDSDVVKLQLLVNKIPVDAVAQVMHRSQSTRAGRAWVEKFKEFVDRQLFEVVIQAAVGKKIVARETVKPVRKDVTAKLYGGDPTRRMKLLEKQKQGRKKLKGKTFPFILILFISPQTTSVCLSLYSTDIPSAIGNVSIDSTAFHGFLKKDT